MSVRDRAIEFVEENHRAVIGVTAGALAVLVLVLGLAIGAESKRAADRKREAASLESMRIRPEEFRYPSDPLPIPGIQRFRERKPVWSVAEARSWYLEPSPESLDVLREAATAQIDSILEAVP